MVSVHAIAVESPPREARELAIAVGVEPHVVEGESQEVRVQHLIPENIDVGAVLLHLGHRVGVEEAVVEDEIVGVGHGAFPFAGPRFILGLFTMAYAPKGCWASGAIETIHVIGQGTAPFYTRVSALDWACSWARL